MMTTCLVFVLVILLPCSAYVGRYHLMVLVILVMSVLAVATLRPRKQEKTLRARTLCVE